MDQGNREEIASRRDKHLHSVRRKLLPELFSGAVCNFHPPPDNLLKGGPLLHKGLFRFIKLVRLRELSIDGNKLLGK